MKHKGKIVLALTVVLVFFANTALVDATSLKELDNQIKDKKEQLEKGKKQEKEMMDEIVDLERTINDLDAEIASGEKDLEQLKADLEEAKKRVAKQNKDLSKRLRIMYKNGSVGFMDVLMNSGNFTDFLTNLDMVQRIFENDQDVLKRLEKAHKTIKKKKEEVESLQQDLIYAQQTAESEKINVSEQKEALTKANKQAADDIGDLEAERKSLEAELAAKAAEGKISNSKTSKYKGGAFSWPTPGYTTVTSEYGWRNCPFHGREFHAAIDIGADSGANIIASSGGEVIQAGWYGGFGNSVIIDHGGGITTQYNHCSSVLVSEGQKVKKGQTIALVGSTGYSTGPHLDFRVYENGNAVSPWSYL